MDRTRIMEEVVEILANKLHQLPTPPSDRDADPDFDYENQVFSELVQHHLDIAEVSMDLEDAFGVNFEETLPGGAGLETIGQVVDFIHLKVNAHRGG